MSFESDMNLWKQETETLVSNKVKDVVRRVYSELLDNSPTPSGSIDRESPYSVGSYVLSHRISGDSVDTSTTVLDKYGPKYSGAKSDAMNETDKLSSMNVLTQRVNISNSIPWVRKVEFLGWGHTGEWQEHGMSASPYHTFERTENVMDMLAQNILDMP